MKKENIKNKIKQLSNELNKYNYEYYVLNSSSISDETYDNKMKELKMLERKYPYLREKNSPTVNVGGEASNKFNKVLHSQPMLSLGNVFDIDGVTNFCQKIIKKYTNVTFVCELKIDGLAINLEYINGKLKIASTRGDGKLGEDVTKNIMNISDIPKVINFDEQINVRGEIFFTKTQFKKINDQRRINGEKQFSNGRNAAAGTVRQLDANITKKRKLNSFIYATTNQGYKSLGISEQFMLLKKLEDLGFNVEKNYKKCYFINEIIEYIDYWTSRRNNLDYYIDGIVIKVNNISLHNTLGVTSKEPKWAIAYKFPAHIVETRIKKIFLTVGRTGKITPNAVLEPIKLEGTVVSHATIHNIKILKDNDIRENDVVFIKKAGDIIPQIVRVVKTKRNKNSKPYVLDDKCPSCGKKLLAKNNGRELYCTNNNCYERVINRLLHFVSKDAMNIQGLGKNTIEKLYNNRIISNFADIYTLKREEFLKLEGFKEKSISNLLSSIQKSKDTPADKVLFALGIDHVGYNVSTIILNNYKNILNLINIYSEELNNIYGIGKVISKSISEWFSFPQNIHLLNQLAGIGINMEYKKSKDSYIKTGKLYKKNILITGKFRKYSRKEIISILESEGAIVSNNTNKNVNLLLVGDNPGNKLDFAKKRAIDIITLKELKEKFSLKLEV